MKVQTIDGLVPFKPKEVFRLDGLEEHTQFRGQIRIPNTIEWIDYDWWFDLNKVYFENYEDDLNSVIGLPVYAKEDFYKEVESNINNYLSDNSSPSIPYTTTYTTTCTCPKCNPSNEEVNEQEFGGAPSIRKEIEKVLSVLDQYEDKDLLFETHIVTYDRLLNLLERLHSIKQ